MSSVNVVRPACRETMDFSSRVKEPVSHADTVSSLINVLAVGCSATASRRHAICCYGGTRLNRQPVSYIPAIQHSPAAALLTDVCHGSVCVLLSSITIICRPLSVYYAVWYARGRFWHIYWPLECSYGVRIIFDGVLYSKFYGICYTILLLHGLVVLNGVRLCLHTWSWV